MIEAPLKVGDHVTARTSAVVPAGTPGTILQSLLSMRDRFVVQFDGYAWPKLIRADELEYANGTPDAD
jgi:hypothetical protein